jgi:hypothetical protein
MATRGILGFVYDGKLKCQYNHRGSGPSGLGLRMLSFAKRNRRATIQLPASVLSLKVVSQATPPSPLDFERLRSYADLSVSTGQTDEWYVLLRRTQGDPDRILQSGYIEDGSSFAKDSLSCQWGYILDTDRSVLEVYRGSQTEQHHDGRFASHESLGGWFPIRLVATYPYLDLPGPDRFVQELDNFSYTI